MSEQEADMNRELQDIENEHRAWRTGKGLAAITA
jgi:hypothetical protein